MTLILILTLNLTLTIYLDDTFSEVYIHLYRNANNHHFSEPNSVLDCYLILTIMLLLT